MLTSKSAYFAYIAYKVSNTNAFKVYSYAYACVLCVFLGELHEEVT